MWHSCARPRGSTVVTVVVSGEKTFITSGMRADFYTVAVRTGGGGASRASRCC